MDGALPSCSMSAPAAEEITTWLVTHIAHRLDMPPEALDCEQSLLRYGLDSLAAMELVADLEDWLECSLPMTLLWEYPTITAIAAYLAATVRTAGALPNAVAPLPEASPRPPTRFPLSHGQRALWLLQQQAPDSPAYNIACALRITGTFAIAGLQTALQQLVERHAALRTTFPLLHGTPTQYVQDHAQVVCQLEEATHWSEDQVQAYLATAAHRPFALEDDTPWRVALLRRAEHEHILLLVMHHIMTDFWSFEVLVHELGLLYRAAQHGEAAELAPLAQHYADYVRWQADWLTVQDHAEAYWVQQLAEANPVLHLPTDRPRPALQTWHGHAVTAQLSSQPTTQLKALSQAQGTTLYTTLLSAFAVLLQRYAGQDDLLIGSPMACRSQAAWAGIIGYFANPVVLRARLDGNPAFTTFLAQMQQTVLGGLEHQHYPFSVLVERLQPERDPSRTPLFQVMFVLQQARPLNDRTLAALALGSSAVQFDLAGLATELIPLPQQATQCDMTLYMAEVEGCLAAALHYNTDLFETARMQRFLGDFETLLTGIVAAPQTPIASLPLLTLTTQPGLPAGPTTQIPQQTPRPYVAPRTPVERLLANIWAEVLEVEQVGILDNFFALGGDSMRSLRICEAVQQAGIPLTIQALYQHQTIAALAQTSVIVSATLVTPPPPLALLTDVERHQRPAGVVDISPAQMAQTHRLEQPPVSYTPSCSLPVAQQQALLETWNATQADYPDTQCLHELFEAQVERTPEGIALVCGETQLTFRALNAQANQLAHYLQRHGVGPDTPVGLCMERSLALIVGIFGILKAGGAYLPLDPAYPPERLRFMLADAQPAVLVTHTTLVSQLPQSSAGTTVICLDSAWADIARESATNPVCETTPDHLAYVIYTSGSTGQPKGVQGLHRGAVNRCAWMWQAYPYSATDVGCQKTSLNFVDSVWEIFGPLLQGVRLVLFSNEVVRDPQCLVAALAQHAVSRLVLVPSLLRILLDTCADLQERLPHLSLWISSGEALPLTLARRFHQCLPDRRLLNLYGSSEVAADVTYYDTHQLSEQHTHVPIGRPLANTQIYLLDADKQPVPLGTPGELYVGGAGLARGYLKRPELTAERFVTLSLRVSPGRLYKTGDMARYLPDGNLEYLGRLDQQVKLRGIRIELGEISTALEQHPAIRQALATVREDHHGDARLVAYVVVHQAVALSTHDLRSFLQTTLPEYMVPSTFVLLEHLPLTPNGKVDWQALTAASLPSSPMRAARAPVVTEPVSSATLVPLHSTGANTPLFCLPPAGGQALVYRLLAEHLGAERPVYALQSCPETLLSPQSLAALASLYTTVIRQQQPEGPYLLLGWSFGGVLALAVAQCLEQQRQQVALVGLIDTFFPQGTSHETDALWSLALACGSALSSALCQLDPPAQQTLRTALLPLAPPARLEALLHWGQAHGIPRPEASPEFVLQQAGLIHNDLRLLRSHTVQALHAPISAWWASAGFSTHVQRPQWEHYTCGRVSTAVVAGDHWSVLQAPAVEALAAAVREALHCLHVDTATEASWLSSRALIGS